MNLAGLAGLSDLTRLVGAGGVGGRDHLGEQHRMLEEQRSRLLGSMRGPGGSDRGRIDRLKRFI